MSDAQSAALHRTYDLYRIGRAINDGERAEVWNKVLDHILHEFDATSASVALIDKEKHELTIIGGVGHPIDLVGKTIAVGEGVMGWVAKQNCPLLLNEDPAQDQRFDNVPHRPNKPHSAMCWPLVVDRDVIGVLSVNRGEHSPHYTNVDLEQGSKMIDLVSVVIDNARLHVEREHRIQLLSEEKHAQQVLVEKLKEAQEQILRSDRMASIGHLAAGVAHEINNPIGYVSSNIATLGQYVQDLARVLEEYESIETEYGEAHRTRLARTKTELDLEETKADIQDLLNESLQGIKRVKDIVQDLKTFCHVAHNVWEYANLHDGISSTLNIVGHETKYKGDIIQDYGEIPPVECVPSQLNQVFMNLLVNAAHSIEETGTITIRTRSHENNWVSVAFSDTGLGIPPEDVTRIFEPLFTTKPAGVGSGLGLSVCAGIVKTHGGHIEVSSVPGQGSTFTVWLPVTRADAEQVPVGALDEAPKGL